MCLQGVVVSSAMSFSSQTKQKRATEEEKVFLEAVKYKFLDPTFPHVVKTPQTASDVWTLITLHNTCANKNKLILRFLLDRKRSSLHFVWSIACYSASVTVQYRVLSWKQHYSTQQLKSFFFFCTNSCPWLKQLAPFDRSARILIWFPLLYSGVTINLVYLPSTANSITSLNCWRLRTKLHLYDKLLFAC